MCFASHHESVPEGYATVSHDDGDGAGDVGTTAGNTRSGGDHAQGSKTLHDPTLQVSVVETFCSSGLNHCFEFLLRCSANVSVKYA